MATTRWLRKKDIRFTKSMLMLAESKMRNQAIRALNGWEGASTFVFGGSIRKTILSESTIERDVELQTRLAQDNYQEMNLSDDHFLPLCTDLDVYITDPKDVHDTGSCSTYGKCHARIYDRSACVR